MRLIFLLVLHYLGLKNRYLLDYLLLVLHKVLKNVVFLHQLEVDLRDLDLLSCDFWLDLLLYQDI